MALPLTRHRFTVAEFHQMADAGIFTEDDRVELLDGEIIDMSPIGHRHAACVDRLTRLFVTRFGNVAQVRIQNPIVLDDYSEPEPDAALVRPRPDFYASDHPTPREVFLLVEVSDATYETDRRLRIPLYAQNGIREVWLVDLGQQAVIVYRNPTSYGYRTVQTVTGDQERALETFPDLVVKVNEILGGGSSPTPSVSRA